MVGTLNIFASFGFEFALSNNVVRPWINFCHKTQGHRPLGEMLSRIHTTWPHLNASLVVCHFDLGLSDGKDSFMSPVQDLVGLDSHSLFSWLSLLVCLFASNVVVAKLLRRGMMKWLGMMHSMSLLSAEVFVSVLLFLIPSTWQMNVLNDCWIQFWDQDIE